MFWIRTKAIGFNSSNFFNSLNSSNFSNSFNSLNSFNSFNSSNYISSGKSPINTGGWATTSSRGGNSGGSGSLRSRYTARRG